MQPDHLTPDPARRHRQPPAFGLTTGRPKPNADPSLSIFLGLYLLVLAFFILLVSLSTIEEMKARAVMESLTATFGNARPSGTSTGPGEGDPALLLERRLTAAFASVVHIAEIRIVKPGRLLRAELPVAQVFAEEEAALRPALQPLLDRVVAAMSSAPGGAAVAVEVALAGATGTGARGGQERLAAARADGFARELLARGAPAPRLSIALAPQAGDRVWLTFAIDGRRKPTSAAGSGAAS
jgi:flagellar motor protein MotB